MAELTVNEQEDNALTVEETSKQAHALATKFADLSDDEAVDFNVAFGAGSLYLAVIALSFIQAYNLPFTDETIQRIGNKLYKELGQAITFVMNHHDETLKAANSVETN